MKQNLPHKFFIKKLLFLFFIFINLQGHGQFIANDTTFINEVSLHKYAKIVNVGKQNYTIDQIIKDTNLKFKPLLVENTDLGFTSDNYWVKFEIFNNTNSDIVPFIETSRPIVDVADLYLIEPGEKPVLFKSGDLVPFNERPVNSRRTIFRVNLEPGELTTFYLHLKSDGEVINVPIYLKTSIREVEEASSEQFIFGIFYGLLAIAAIIYMFFYFAIKEKSFLYYSLYVVFIGLLQFSVDGFFYQYFAPDTIWMSTHCVLVSATIANFFLGKYSQTFLNIKMYSKTIYRLFYVLYALDFLSLVSIFIFHNHELIYPLANFLGLILLLLIVSSVVVVFRKTGEIDNYFATGIAFLIIGFVIFIVKNLSLLPSVFWTENSSKLGTGVEVVFLSLSMANLIRKLRNDREELQTLALRRSEEMNELKSYFLSNISHELRTPLNTIVNLLDLSKTETDKVVVINNTEIMQSSAQTLLCAVNDILDFSKIEKNELKLEFNKFDIHKLLNEIGKDISLRAHEKNLIFQYVPSETLPKTFYGDEGRLRQILTNLLYNSYKFTNQGIMKFSVSYDSDEASIGNLLFIISDTGIGIPKEKMSSIFDSFSQDNINNKRKYGGLGLGLYIVKALVNLYKGSIEVDSIVNQGTVFTIKIPMEAIIEEQKLITDVVQDFDLSGKRILVVEDNAMNQMVIKMITKKWLNTTIDYVFNGQEAIEILNNVKYDIILMDLQMPVMDGYEATIAIRSGNCGINEKNIPIIAVTADVMEATKDRVKEIGMNYYISKPVSKDLLYKTILEIA